jgi:DNA-binding NtrC family response regulator
MNEGHRACSPPRANMEAVSVPPPKDETFTESPGAQAPLAAPEAHLFAVLDCDRPSAGSTRHSLRAVSEVTIGRGPERAAAREGTRLALTSPSGWMSADHARLRRDGRGWLLEDAGSRNGTRVDGKPVVHLALADGDVFEAGHVLFLFREAVHAPPDASPDLDTRTARFPARGLGTTLPALSGEIDSLVRIAASMVPVLLRGDTGTGKEVTARAVHTLSGRRGPFVAVNCGAIPDALVESHLFGHTRGAFSGAVREEPGFVRSASGGTLFLDEIGDLPATSQSALLRVLQEGEVIPVGSTRAVPVDLRIVAATHQPLEALVARATFRTDLLARLDGFTFVLPALRERREDIGLLAGDLLAAIPEAAGVKLSPDAGRALVAYDWPQNVRELGHCLARACALARGEEVVDVKHLPPAVRAAIAGDARAPDAIDAPDASDDARLRAQIESLLRQHHGNVAEVARALGKARMQVHRWLKRFGIDPDWYRP